jgi:hypothetical protein
MCLSWFKSTIAFRDELVFFVGYLGMFGWTYLSLPTGINTCGNNLRLVHKLYENSLTLFYL